MNKNLEQAQGPPLPLSRKVCYGHVLYIYNIHTFWTFHSESLTRIDQVLDLLSELICWHDRACRARRGPLGHPLLPCCYYMMPDGSKNMCKP
jgi:hypothetical protein